MTVRVLVTGSRNWEDRATIERVLTEIKARYGIIREDVVIVHGGARGADRMAGWIAQQLGMKVEVHPADWARHGKRAGYVRNQEMIDTKPDLVLGFMRQNSPGTRMCISLAQRAEIPVEVYEA